jgi:hypothetical protein
VSNPVNGKSKNTDFPRLLKTERKRLGERWRQMDWVPGLGDVAKLRNTGFISRFT